MEPIENNGNSAPVPTDSKVELDSAPKTNPEPAPVPVSAEEIPARVKLSTEALIPAGDDWHAAKPTIHLFNDSVVRANEDLNNSPQIAPPPSPTNEYSIYDTVTKAPQSAPFANVMSRPLEELDREWQQRIDTENGFLSGNRPAFKDPGKKLTGEKGMLHVRSLLGLGSTYNAPLWHSGFWISMKAPTEAALLDLDRRLGEEKVSLGRLTHGLLFSNKSVFINSILTEFALEHVYMTTLVNDSPEELRRKILVPDIPILLWCLACTIWASGFQYTRLVMQDGEPTQRRDKIDIRRLQVTDRRSLTEKQIRHMSNFRNKDMTDASIAEYQKEFVRGQPKRVEIADDISLELKVPTLEEYIASGTNWINSIVTLVDKSFGLSPADEKRDRFIREHGNASYLRQYAHWIKAIHLADEHFVEDHQDVEETLDVLSGMTTLKKNFIEEVVTYTEDSTISTIVVPVECPDDEKRVLPRFSRVVPLDVTSVFFILLSQKAAHLRAA